MDTDFDPGEKGSLNNQKALVGGFYQASEQLGIGFGYYAYYFTVSEPGYCENCDYSGMSLMGKYILPKTFNIGLIYAPSLKVSDHVKGDWNDPDRSASVSYSGSYWELSLKRDFVFREDIRIGLGLLYSCLAGDGKEHPDYRFLPHTFKEILFTTNLEWIF